MDVVAVILTATGFSNDPYLSGVLAAQTIDAVQSQGVITSLKVSGYNYRCSLKTNRGPSALHR